LGTLICCGGADESAIMPLSPEYMLAGNLEIRKLVIFTFYEYLFPKVRCTYFFLEKVIGISDLPV
jgi:hypothetical protein